MFTDNQVTRFPNGINNVSVADMFNSMKQEDPTKYHSYLEDFDYFNSANWTVTETQAGATQALANGDGGILALVNSAANNDVNQVQKVGESYQLSAGKKFFMRCRVSVDDATNAALAIGLQVTNTDGTLGTVTDGVYFIKPAASTSVSINFRKNAAAGANTAVVGTMANATYTTLDCFYDGIDRIWYGKDGVVIGYMDASATYLPDTTLAPVAVVKNGTAAARTMNVDYIYVAQER